MERKRVIRIEHLPATERECQKELCVCREAGGAGDLSRKVPVATDGKSHAAAHHTAGSE